MRHRTIPSVLGESSDVSSFSVGNIEFFLLFIASVVYVDVVNDLCGYLDGW